MLPFDLFTVSKILKVQCKNVNIINHSYY